MSTLKTRSKSAQKTSKLKLRKFLDTYQELFFQVQHIIHRFSN